MVIPCPKRACGVLIRVPPGRQTTVTCPHCRMSFNFGPVLIGACPRCGGLEFEQVERADGAAQDFCRACRWPAENPTVAPNPSNEPPAGPTAGRLSPTISLSLAGLAVTLAVVGLLGGGGSISRAALLLLIPVGPLALLALCFFTQWPRPAGAGHAPQAGAEQGTDEVPPSHPEEAATPENVPASVGGEEEAERGRFLELVHRDDFFASLPPPAFAALVTEIFRLDGAEVLRHPAEAGGTGDAIMQDHEGKFLVRCLPAFDPFAREPFRDFHRALAEEDARGYVVTTARINPTLLAGTSGKEITLIGPEGLERLARDIFSEAYVLGPSFQWPMALPELPGASPQDTAQAEGQMGEGELVAAPVPAADAPPPSADDPGGEPSPGQSLPSWLRPAPMSGAREIPFAIKALRPGMILTRNVVTQSGRVIIGKDTRMTPQYVERIENFMWSDPVEEPAYVSAESA